jgi:hypothetical protein
MTEGLFYDLKVKAGRRICVAKINREQRNIAKNCRINARPNIRFAKNAKAG